MRGENNVRLINEWWADRRMVRRLHPGLQRTAIAVAAVQAGLAVVAIGLWWPVSAGRVSGAFAGLAWIVLLVAIVILEFGFSRLVRSEWQLQEETARSEREREQTEEAFRLIRAQRHDFLAHAGALQFMAKEGKWEEAAAYLGDLLEDYGRVNTAIQGEKAHVAALLLRAMQRAEATGIRLTLDLSRPLSELPLPPQEQSKLVSNVLNNALEAAEACEPGERWVKMTSLVGGGLYVLEADNSTVPLPADMTDRLFRTYGLSTKGGHRGVGTYIIASITRKYRGLLEYSATGGRFRLKLKFPVIQ